MKVTGADLIAEARKLVGSPHFHMGRTPETGLDCIGVILVPAMRLGLTAVETPTYSPGDQTYSLLDFCEEHGERIEGAGRPGDVALFCIRTRIQHMGYLVDGSVVGGRMIHSNEKAGKVCESVIDDTWAQRLAGIYRWRGLAECSP